MLYARVAQIFQKSRSYLKFLDARKVTRNKFRTDGPQILGAASQNLVARPTWCLEFLYFCCIVS